MNSTHIHLLLNHFPVIGTLLGGGLLIWGILRKQDQVKSIASVVLVLMALLAIPVFLTGEPAEESVEELPGVSESMLHLHESAAELAIWIMGITGLAAFIALLSQAMKKPAAKSLYVITAFLSVMSFAAMARTGYYGGQIRHSEIRQGAQVNSEQGNENEKGGGKETKKEKDDD